MSNSHSLTAPDEFCATRAKTFPTTKCQFCGASIGCTVPAFHRLRRDPVSDSGTTDINRLCQWRRCAGDQFVVARNVDLLFGQIASKTLDVTQSAQVCVRRHAV